jgi:hypothetical protein
MLQNIISLLPRGCWTVLITLTNQPWALGRTLHYMVHTWMCVPSTLSLSLFLNALTSPLHTLVLLSYGQCVQTISWMYMCMCV